MELDPVFLSRLQFAFVVSFHIIFPAFTIGLAAWLATLEGTRLATGNPVYRRVSRRGSFLAKRGGNADTRTAVRDLSARHIARPATFGLPTFVKYFDEENCCV